MRGWRQSMAVGAWVTWLCAAAQAAETRPNVVLVQPEGAKPNAFISQVRALEAPLNKAVGLVPLADYVRAGQSLGLKPAALYGDESAVAVGRLVNATHVLFLRPLPAPAQSQKSRGRPEMLLSVLLVDTKTGESSLDTRLPVPRGSGAQSKVAQQLSQAIVAACAAPALASVPAPALAAVTPKASQHTEDPKALPAPPPLETPIPPEVAQGTELPSTNTQVPPLAVLPAPVVQPAISNAADASFWEAERRLPHGVEVALGALFYQRQSLLSESGRAQLEYGASSSGGRAPLFARGTVDFTLLPSRWHKHRLNAADGLLAFGHFELGTARTYQTDGNVASLGSYAYRLGLGYRSPLWRGPRAMVATLRVGYSQYLFASHKGVPYPAIGMRGVLVGLGLEAPLGTRHVALLGSIAVIAKPKPFASAAELGEGLSSSLGGVADAGLRFTVGPVDFDLLFSWERYSARFFGEGQTPNLGTQFISPTLVDQNVGGKARVGLHF